MGQIIEHSPRGAHRHTTVSFRIQDDAETRRKIHPVGVVRLSTSVKPGVARELQTCWSIYIQFRTHTRIKRCLIEVDQLVPQFLHARERFPTKAGAHSQPRRGLPTVLDIQSEIAHARVVLRDIRLSIGGGLPCEEVAQDQTGLLRTEGEGTGCIQQVVHVLDGANVVHSDSNLMPSSNQTQIIRKLVTRRRHFAGITEHRNALESAGSHSNVVWY